MDKGNTFFRIAIYEIKKWKTNPKIIVLLLLSGMYIHYMLRPVAVFAKSVEICVSPFIFPFLMSSNYSIRIFSLMAVLLFCDAPFWDGAHLYIFMRSGRRKYYIGQQIYIFMAAGIFTIYLFGMTNLVLIPELGSELGWGKVINTFVQTGSAVRYGIAIPFDNSITANFSPCRAVVLEIFLCWLLFAFLGNLIYFFNMVILKPVGIIASVACILFQIIAEDISPEWVYVSPVSWVSLSTLDIMKVNNYPDLGYAFIALCGLNVLLGLMSAIYIKKHDVVLNN